MTYCFDIVGIAPVLDFFYYQQKVEQSPHRSKAYLGSYECTLDSFIQSTEMILQKPDWNWDQVIESIIDFWLHQEKEIEKWRSSFTKTKEEILIIGRIANVNLLRRDFDSLI
ncbi:hypothetical protein VKI21_04410 [Cyanobacterium aponinum UTEX 3222]|uniref:Uncharacterized protein n=2 Tax=Cyanobacterium aponinum TaxID=379064 RepID=K9Z900_CYAAP|nr:hypothetical protein [Cyanobacterium aponinum]WRL42933.1 hypothetical protein VKI21_04410 [Cyanobacterium aponinum UTEX 3222]AFZ55080.1 hypothetical protein Cyan10605_3021 [Cyanobacterium aponinum PCC 10605]MBD2393663.1 hypothetical protein [Cyanobacterium aponinum FACHB-4101]PHV63578.1 hypothetical protein CSQ80_04400 [Cyanobacterium aponinum IPPAS B-1201]WPF88217.1 hypothetical protein SAY89_15670 [Cyanobacterium aponinum AL20115]